MIKLENQESIRFNGVLIEYFIIKVLNIKKFLITDASYVSDFLTLRKKILVKINENEYQSKMVIINGKKLGKKVVDLTDEERKVCTEVCYQVHKREDLIFDEDIIIKTKEIFDIDLPVNFLNGSLVDLGHFLSQNITEEKRKEIDEYFNGIKE